MRIRPTFSLLATIAISIATSIIAHGQDGAFVPAGLDPGDEYHLVFATSGNIDGTSDDIAVYNAFVNDQAALNPESTGTGIGVTWSAIASTPAVVARVNALIDAPVYLLDSSLVASGFEDMWDGEINVPISIDQFGNPVPFSTVWTGSFSDGTAASTLGGSNSTFGFSGETSSQWIAAEDKGNLQPAPIYALSEKLTVPMAGTGTNVMVTRKQLEPAVDSGPLSFQLNALPDELDVTILLGPGTLMSGLIAFDLDDVISANVVLGDGEFTELESFQMLIVQSTGAIQSMSAEFAAIDTPTVSDGIIIANSPANITGTDIASGLKFSYTYGESVDTVEMMALLGDVNRDGAINLLDVTPFIDRLSNGTFQLEADINEDGLVNLLDISPFIAILSGTCPDGIPDDSTLLGVPLEIGFDGSTLVDAVLVTIKNSWLCENQDYEFFLDIDITGVNGKFQEHGTQFVSVHDTKTFDVDGPIASVIVDWTTDKNTRNANETYTVCVQVVRHDIQQDLYEDIGELKCSEFGPF